ncbi:MAG TPA: GTPase Era [Chloroflexi bacterium]|nr:GTPase Era [Chloroflexota bacterium]
MDEPNDEYLNDELIEEDLFLDEELPPGHRAGYVAVIGKPNVGKSTLMNVLLGEKVAIVSPKPQTTRDRQLGILTLPEAQIIFVDTPGIHRARNRLGEYMVERATEAIPDADLILFMVDISEMPGKADEIIAELVNEQEGTPALLVMNKSDLISGDVIARHQAAYQALVPRARPIMISATRGDNVPELLDMIIEALPEGPRYFPPDQLTDAQLRDSAAEIIREKVLLLYEQEVPHSVAVEIEEFKERSEDLTYIRATIYVERESQKGILIGQGGKMLKKLGQMARPELEEMLGTRVYLDLWVKVLKNWRKNEQALRRLGYRLRKRR